MTKSYRLRLWNFAGSAVQWSFASEVLSAPTVGGQVVRPLDGRTETKPWVVNVIDANDAVTAAISDSGGRLVVMRRKADVQVSVDGAAYTTMATGRVTGVRITSKSPLVYEFEISDERLVERTTKLWTDCSTTKIHPPGFVAGTYGPFENRYTSDGGVVTPVLSVTTYSNLSEVLLPFYAPSDDLRRVVNSDIKPGLATVPVSHIVSGSFYNLRASVGGTDYDVVSFENVRPGDGTTLVVDIGPTALAYDNQLMIVVVLDPDGDIAVGDEFYLYFPSGRAPDEAVPYHVDNIDPFQLVADIYDDLGVAYDTDRLGTYNESTNPTGLIGHPWFPGDMRWRITEGEAICSRWLEDNIYKPMGVLPVTDESGNVVPVPLLMTWSYEVPDPDALFTFDDSNISADGLPTWEHDIGTLANVIEATYTVETEGYGGDTDEAGLDGIIAEEDTYTVKYDTADSGGSRYFGESVHEIGLHGLHIPGRVKAWIGTTEDTPGFSNWAGGIGPGGLASELFQRFGDGAVLSQLTGLSATSSVSLGDWVLVDSEVMPSPDTGDRTGERLMQVIGKETSPSGYNFTLLDGGPNSAPLSAPTITVAQHTRSPDKFHTLRVTVTGVTEGATWVLQVAEYPSEPSASSSEWRTCATGVSAGSSSTVAMNIGDLPSNARYYFRARATKASRIGSGWSSRVTAITPSYDNPGSFAYANVTGGTADLTWTLSNVNEHLQPLLQVGTGAVKKLPAGTEAYTLTGLSTSTEYTVTVRVVDPYYSTDLNGSLAGRTATASVTFTTTGTYTTLTAPTSIKIDIGDASTTSEAP